MLKKARAKTKAKREAQEARDARLAERGETIDKLREALAVAMLDPTYSVEDIVTIKNAITQQMEPDSCPEACKRLAEEALAIERRVNMKLMEGIVSDLVERQNEAAAMREMLDIVTDPASTPTLADFEAMRTEANNA